MKLYIARHGQTDWNLEMRAQGRKDQPLNNTGREQAHELGKKIADLDFEVCYASPLKRAAETAEIAVGDRNEIVYDNRLVEISAGKYEGQVIKCWVDMPGVDDVKNGVEPGGSGDVKSRAIH